MRLTPYRKHPEAPAWPRLRDRMDRLFQSVFAEPWREFAFPESGGWAPDVDVKETDRTIEVRAEIPGMDASEIQISARGDTLTISGEKREESREENENAYISEIHYGAFQRVVELPESADPDKIVADYDKGVLRITISKKEGATPKRISVKAAPGEEKKTQG